MIKKEHPVARRVVLSLDPWVGCWSAAVGRCQLLGCSLRRGLAVAKGGIPIAVSHVQRDFTVLAHTISQLLRKLRLEMKDLLEVLQRSRADVADEAQVAEHLEILSQLFGNPRELAEWQQELIQILRSQMNWVCGIDSPVEQFLSLVGPNECGFLQRSVCSLHGG
ncbi:MAG: hypothetical protein HOE53_04930 [Candidatus Magasanikbacteria bacterium]|nr:hypothetical protein [Candidatus Magasanikbacteria bacterium]